MVWLIKRSKTKIINLITNPYELSYHSFKKKNKEFGKKEEMDKPFWPFEKSKTQLREEIWQAFEKEIRDFTKSLIEAILENTIKEYLQLEKYQRSKQKKRYYRNGYY